MQRHGNRHNEVIFHAEAHRLSRGKVLERVFQLWQELRVYLAQQGYPISTSFQGKFWLYLNLNSRSWIVQPFTCEEIDLGFSYVAATRRKRQDTTNVKLKLMKVDFPAHEVCTIPSMDKKRNHLICCDCSR